MTRMIGDFSSGRQTYGGRSGGRPGVWNMESNRLRDNVLAAQWRTRAELPGARLNRLLPTAWRGQQRGRGRGRGKNRGRGRGGRGLVGCLGGLVLVLGCSSGRPAELPLTLPERPVLTTASWAQCAASTPDADADGVGDACELVLATHFAPVLIIDGTECNVDPADLPPPLKRLLGGYTWAVQPVGELIRIAYLPAYEVDCGWEG